MEQGNLQFMKCYTPRDQSRQSFTPSLNVRKKEKKNKSTSNNKSTSRSSKKPSEKSGGSEKFKQTVEKNIYLKKTREDSKNTISSRGGLIFQKLRPNKSGSLATMKMISKYWDFNSIIFLWAYNVASIIWVFKWVLTTTCSSSSSLATQVSSN